MRYTGAVCKLCRREQTKLFLKGDKCQAKCTLDKRPMPPGAARPQRGKPSAFAVRLREKQKLRRLVSMAEKPFERLVVESGHAKESSGDHLLRALELRLDSVVRRIGLATSLKQARQLVRHGHVRVGGKRIGIPSYSVRVGDIVSLDPKYRGNVGIKLSLETAKRLNQRPSYMTFDEAEFSAKIVRLPERAEMSFPVNEQLIIEYYSK
jgi:small subunit ribosomal protein S4